MGLEYAPMATRDRRYVRSVTHERIRQTVCLPVPHPPHQSDSFLQERDTDDLLRQRVISSVFEMGGTSREAEVVKRLVSEPVSLTADLGLWNSGFTALVHTNSFPYRNIKFKARILEFSPLAGSPNTKYCALRCSSAGHFSSECKRGPESRVQES